MSLKYDELLYIQQMLNDASDAVSIMIEEQESLIENSDPILLRILKTRMARAGEILSNIL